jgi:hypothetical protein
MSFVNDVTAAIGKFQESTNHDPALAEVLTQILKAFHEIEQRFEALEAALWSKPFLSQGPGSMINANSALSFWRPLDA